MLFSIIPLAIKKHAKLKADLLQDLEKGKKTEVVTIIHEIEDGEKDKLGK